MTKSLELTFWCGLNIRIITENARISIDRPNAPFVWMFSEVKSLPVQKIPEKEIFEI